MWTRVSAPLSPRLRHFEDILPTRSLQSPPLGGIVAHRLAMAECTETLKSHRGTTPATANSGLHREGPPTPRAVRLQIRSPSNLSTDTGRWLRLDHWQHRHKLRKTTHRPRSQHPLSRGHRGGRHPIRIGMPYSPG